MVGHRKGRPHDGHRQGEDSVTPHTRPPVDDDADHTLVRTVECIEGKVEIDLICEPVFDYGATEATWTLVDDSRHMADASGAGRRSGSRRISRSASKGEGFARDTR